MSHSNVDYSNKCKKRNSTLHYIKLSDIFVDYHNLVCKFGSQKANGNMNTNPASYKMIRNGHNGQDGQKCRKGVSKCYNIALKSLNIYLNMFETIYRCNKTVAWVSRYVQEDSSARAVIGSATVSMHSQGLYTQLMFCCAFSWFVIDHFHSGLHHSHRGSPLFICLPERQCNSPGTRLSKT